MFVKLETLGMSPVSCVIWFFVSYVLLVSLAQEDKNSNPRCPPFNCGNLGRVGFPFSNETHPQCGLWKVYDCRETAPRIKLGKDGQQFYVTSISQDNSLELRDNKQFDWSSETRTCDESLMNLTIPHSPFISFELSKNQTLFQCPLDNISSNFHSLCNDSEHSFVYYNSPNHDRPRGPPAGCSLIQFHKNEIQEGLQLFNLFTRWFRLQVQVTTNCQECYHKGGNCEIDREGKFQCPNARTDERKQLKIGLRLGIGIGIGGSMVLMLVLCIWFIQRRKKQKYTTPSFHSRYSSSDPSSLSELEVGSVYFGVPVFSYTELAEATNNFSPDNKIGDGGFGTVYYGKLQDGREVAVKHLYEHNYRRLQQFMNEVKILTSLRHKNLVSLYGCTSRHSPGLLLVYEFVSNGSVADHLHGDQPKPGSLTWAIRMSIASETARALVYLHTSNIIHRDVKTHNILLDSNFCVKVADLGLSRLLPTHVSHVSTVPQGTPGYVDPEYHQCYQLTDKSDVYSFGVVLIELISSMPAVDISRDKSEINLSNLAINKIQKCAIEELVDPYLGCQSNEETKRMINSVAELAFLCLQQSKEMRPSMADVLLELEKIESGDSKPENLKKGHEGNEMKSKHPPSPPDSDDLALLKPIQVLSSPSSVTAKWISIDTTPDSSG